MTHLLTFKSLTFNGISKYLGIFTVNTLVLQTHMVYGLKVKPNQAIVVKSENGSVFCGWIWNALSVLCY